MGTTSPRPSLSAITITWARVWARVRVRKLQMIDQDEAARSAREAAEREQEKGAKAAEREQEKPRRELGLGLGVLS